MALLLVMKFAVSLAYTFEDMAFEDEMWVPRCHHPLLLSTSNSHIELLKRYVLSEGLVGLSPLTFPQASDAPVAVLTTRRQFLLMMRVAALA